MLMANAVMQLAAKTPGKEAMAMESFAKALRQVRLITLIFRGGGGHISHKKRDSLVIPLDLSIVC